MNLKKAYEEMTDNELVERVKNIQDYFPEVQEIMINEIKKRKINNDELDRKISALRFDKSLDLLETKKIEKNKKIVDSYGAASKIIGIFLLLGLLPITVGIIYLFIGVYKSGWIETKAIITKAKEIHNGYTDKGEQKFRYELEYKYVIEGTEYMSNTLTYNNENSGNFIKKFLSYKNKNIIIKYNPQNNEESYIFGYSLSDFSLLPIGGVFILIFFALVKKARADGYNISKRYLITLSIIIEIFICIFFVPAII